MNYQDAMKRITAGLATKSEKIRRLGQAGYTRQQIADFLGIRYQHVRNVLVEEEKKNKQLASGMAESKRSWRAQEGSAGASGKHRVRPDGSAVIPAAALVGAGFRPGDEFFIDIAAEGDVRLLSGRVALLRAQELVRQFVPEGVDLVEELRKDRQLQVARLHRLAGENDE